MKQIPITWQTEIGKPNSHFARRAKEKWDRIAKPLDGLGKLESLVCRIAAIQETTQVRLDRRAVLVMCADNGIVGEGVTQSGQEVTAAVALELARNRASVCRMASYAGAEVVAVDVGIAGTVTHPNLRVCKIREGTESFLTGEAFTEEQLWRAIQLGADLVLEYREKGYSILATGEMGIGNTTTSTALISALLQLPPAPLTGPGAGLGQEGLARKKQVIEQGIALHKLYPGQDSSERAFAARALHCVGGLDIGALVGVFVGGALYKVPIIVDGLISAAAALCAEKMFPGTAAYMLPSHLSHEPASLAALQELKLSPILDAQLCLGEGTGAVLLLPLLDMALQVYHGNTTFSELRMSPYQREH